MQTRPDIVGVDSDSQLTAFMNLLNAPAQVPQRLDAQVPVFLCIPGPPGHESATTFLNNLIGETVVPSDLRSIAVVFAQELKHLSKFELKPVVLHHRHKS